MNKEQSKIFNEQYFKFIKLIHQEFIDFTFNHKNCSYFSSIYIQPKEYLIQKHFEPIINYLIQNVLLTETIVKLLNHSNISSTICSYNDKVLTEDKIGEFILNLDYNKKLCRYSNVSYNDSNDGLFDEILIIDWNNNIKNKNIDSSKYIYISSKDFLTDYFGINLLRQFISFTNSCTIEAENIIGTKTVPALSSSLLNSFRFKVENSIYEYIQKLKKYIIADSTIKEIQPSTSFNCAYQIINKPNINEIVKLEEQSKKLLINNDLISKFEDKNCIKLLLGKSDIFKSLSTSEYMYFQHEKDYCLDYTAIVSGYLKSIEQLLYTIILFRLNKGYKIKYNGIKDANNNQPILYRDKEKKWLLRVEINKNNLQFIDTTMGSMRHFLDENWHLFSIKKGDIECLIACLDKYCNECRNGSFHLNNINPKSKIDFIRNNTFFLYVVLLTTIKLGETQFETDEAFKVIKSTKVERLYNLIITGVSNQFEFIYSDGNKLLNPIDVVYDVYNSDVPSFNEFGQIKSAKLKFNHVNDNLFSLVTERIYPNEIWYRDNKGNKIEVI